MGGRYLITGVQLGILKAKAIFHVDGSLLATLEEIAEKQYIGDSDRNIKDDVLDLLKEYEEKL